MDGNAESCRRGRYCDHMGLTHPTGGNPTPEIVRADVITSVSENSANVLALRSDTRLWCPSHRGQPQATPSRCQPGSASAFCEQ